MKWIGYQTLLLGVLLGLDATAQTATPPAPDAKDVAEVVVSGQQNVSKWFRAESAHFIVYSDTKHDDVTQLLNKLERFDYLLRIYTKVDSKYEKVPKLTLYYHADIDDLDLIARDKPSYAIGLYSSCASGVQGFGAHMYYRAKSTVALEKQPENEGLAYIFEAYARHFLYRYSNLRTPTWYIDGFAQYFAGTRFSDTETIIGMAPASIGEYLAFVNNGHTYSLSYEDILLQNDSDGRNYAGQAGVKLEFQAKSWILTHYIFSSTENIQNFRKYIGLIIDDVEPTKAFEQAFGYSVSKLKNILWKYKFQSAQALKLDLNNAASEEIKFTSLPLAANNLLLVDAALKSCPTPKLGASLLQKARDEAARFPDSEYAQVILSRAQIDWGKPDEALAFLPTAKTTPRFEVAYLTGLANLKLAEQSKGEKQSTYFEAARRYLLRACALNPQSAEAFHAYFKAAVKSQDTPSDEVLGSAILARQFHPEVSTYAKSVALVHAYLKRIPEAEEALRLLKHNNRDPEIAAWATRWQTKIATATPADLLAEMRSEPAASERFDEWTIANDEVMKAVHLAAGLEAARNSIPTQPQQNQPAQDQGNFNNRR